MAIARRGPSAGCAHEPGCRHDIGPAAAGAVDGLAAAGRLSADHLLAGAGSAVGVGPIERRYLAPLTPPQEEGPVTTSAPPPVIPCGDCLHSPVCGLKELLTASVLLDDVEVIGTGLRIRRSPTVECDHHLASLGTSTSGRVVAIAAPSDAERMQASRLRGGQRAAEVNTKPRPTGRRHPSHPGQAAEKAERARRVVEAVKRHGGDRRSAAAELGMRPNALVMVLKHAEGLA